MSVFTDKDLEIVKLGIKVDTDGQETIAIDKLQALIQRLEAAENWALKMNSPADGISGCVEVTNFEKAWRKSAGKEGR